MTLVEVDLVLIPTYPSTSRRYNRNYPQFANMAEELSKNFETLQLHAGRLLSTVGENGFVQLM